MGVSNMTHLLWSEGRFLRSNASCGALRWNEGMLLKKVCVYDNYKGMVWLTGNHPGG